MFLEICDGLCLRPQQGLTHLARAHGAAFAIWKAQLAAELDVSRKAWQDAAQAYRSDEPPRRGLFHGSLVTAPAGRRARDRSAAKIF